LKVLLITGKLAEDMVKGYAKESSVETQVVALNVQVAAFLNPQTIIQALKTMNLKSFDMILVPGLSRGDTASITEAFGVPAFKGPRYAADLPTVLDALGKVKLSTVVPACDLLREILTEKALKEIQNAEQNREQLLQKPGSMLIKNLAIGKGFPMRVMAEIVDAALMEDAEIQQLAKRFVEQGASIIDVGMLAGTSNPENAKRIVKAVKAVVDVPVSIDALDAEEIESAVSAGADMILSADAGNLEKIAPFAKNIPVVVIPTNQREGYFPKKAQERVELLEELIAKAKKLGFSKIIGDLILEPSNVLESFVAFREFANRNPDVPLFVGVSNVTELFDADSVGLNALLARLSSEVDASIILATEKSTKAKGTVKEEVAAAKMMFLAKKRGSVPKDLGVDLLVLKDKRSREEPYNPELELKSKVTLATQEAEPTILDSEGMFKIAVDRKEENIVALQFTTTAMNKPVNIIKGKTAETIYAKIIQLGLVTRLDHAAYLGSELAKAEIALKTGKEYIQDKELFSKKNC
jgi:dihydropteroate synthase-like protein